MSEVIVDAEGEVWWSTAYACEQLGVEPRHLWDWVRRSKNDPTFPRVDPPRRRGNMAAYRAEQVMEAECHTAAAPRGRRRPE